MLDAQKIDIVLLAISNIKEKTRENKQIDKNKKQKKNWNLRFQIAQNFDSIKY